MRFLTFYNKDKRLVKMINHTSDGFELIISEEKINEILQTINNCKQNGEQLDIVWQMKFKQENFIHYKNCTFTEHVDYDCPNNIYFKENKSRLNPFYRTRTIEKFNLMKIKVIYSNTDYYSNSLKYKNSKIKPHGKKNELRYKDGILLDRVVKISSLVK